MKMIVVNKRSEQFSFEVPLADGTVIRELIPAEGTLEVTDIDPFDINTYKLLRQLVFRDEFLTVTFECEPDDLICFGIARIQDEGVDLGQYFTSLNFIGGAVTASASATPGVADVTVTGTATGGLEIGDFKEYVALSGAQNGTNLVYTIPDKAIHAPPGFQLKVYRNGVLLNPGVSNDFTASESGGAGTGFDTITFATGSAPKSYECLWAAYTVFGAGT